MRKLFSCLVMLLVVLACVPARAESYVLDVIYSSVDIPADYTVLTPDNLDAQSAWLSQNEIDIDTLRADFVKRGVLLQGWTASRDACIEVTAVQTDQSRNIFDVNEQSESVRGTYRTSYYPRNEYAGYDFSASSWKNSDSGRFLVLRYVRRGNGEVLYRGMMRRTIRNGYEITLDMQIYDRAVANKDNSNLNKIWNTYHFIEVMPLPAAARAKLNISKIPPQETNSNSFNIEGTAAKGVKLTAVVMGLNHPTPLVSEALVAASGKFKLPITLPKEGVFLITLTGEYEGEDVIELAYPVTYQRTLLTVNLINSPSSVVTDTPVVISGTSEPGASIQVFVNSEAVFTKKVTSEGRFKLEISAKKDGYYEVLLVFSKKNLADRRITLTFKRELSEAERIKLLAADAIKPAYKQLVSKIDGYTGRVMGYKAYITGVTQSGDEWIIQMALTRKSGAYSDIILVTSDAEPGYAVGDRVMMYGTCAGMSVGSSSENTDENGKVLEEDFPCFELLAFAEL